MINRNETLNERAKRAAIERLGVIPVKRFGVFDAILGGLASIHHALIRAHFGNRRGEKIIKTIYGLPPYHYNCRSSIADDLNYSEYIKHLNDSGAIYR